MVAQTYSPTTYKTRLEKLENELFKLKKESRQLSFSTISLKGIWKGVKITESDIVKAKKSLFKGMK